MDPAPSAPVSGSSIHGRKGKANRVATTPPGNRRTDPVQLYDTVADIGETTNLAAKHPEIVKRLQAAYDAHVAEIKANQRPTAEMIRPADAVSPERPGAAKKKPAKKKKK